ncbi:unnamed protein product [Nippostrongylus brasiliensis]|uniref:Peptidase A2 domain-containing protein n=1 Tax=Nippostrongylus brasiliensis TaxID=27835 RepID=A0A0N4XXC7_NIPBR|nr:unnamed protein product [Nippostrongylus brasiliensis]
MLRKNVSVLMTVRMLRKKVSVLIDTGSMASIVSTGVLESAQSRGYDVDTLKVVDKSLLEPAFDASSNRMNFLEGVVIPVQVNGLEAEIAFYISKEKRLEVILGAKALKKFGVKVTWPRKLDRRKLDEPSGKVIVAKRTNVPSHSSALIQAHCDIESESAELVVWATSDAIALGVFKIENRPTTIPVMNGSDEPLVLKEGEQIGEWSTEKWRTRWDDAEPSMLDNMVH